MRRGRVSQAGVFLSAVGVLLLTLVAPVHAINVNAVWPDLGLPGFKLTPFFTERLEYQSNVLLAPRNELDDFISRSIPGVVVELPFGTHRLDLSARAEILRYLKHSQFDNEHFFLLGNLQLNFPGGLKVRMKEQFTTTSDPPGTELTGRINRTTNTINPEVEYGLARRFSLRAGYTFTHVNFDEPVTRLSRNEHTFGLTGYWHMTAKSDLLGNLSYGKINFGNVTGRDSERFFGMVGLRGELTSRLSSTFRFGYEHRESPTQKVNSIITSGDWTFVPSDRTRLILLTQRSLEESVFGTDTTFTATVATLLAQHSFGPKLTTNGRVFIGLNEYPNNDVDGARFHRRTDVLMGLGLGADYQIQRWLAVGADYSVSNRSSNFNGFDYTDHIIGMKVTLSI